MIKKMTFSAKQKDAVDLGVELYKHFCFEKDNQTRRNDRYACFAQTKADNGQIMSYTAKNKILHNTIIDEAYDISGLDKEKFSVYQALSFPMFERAYFAVVEEIINKVDAKTEIESAFQFAEVHSLAEGDSLTFHIPSKHLLAVSTVANGVRNSHLQQLFDQDITIVPQSKKSSVGVDLRKIAEGTIDYGYLINMVVKSFRTKMSQEIVNTMFNVYNTLQTPWVENAYDQDAYIKLAERVSAANSSPATVYGTKIALNKVLPTNDYLKMGVGAEFAHDGYVTNPFGVPTSRLDQSVNPNSAYDFAIPNNYLLFLSSADKICKIGTEGQTTIRQTQQNDTADNRSAYTITQNWAIKIATMANYGIMKVANS